MMIAFTNKIIMNFAQYIPSIKFLGPRNQIAPPLKQSSSNISASTSQSKLKLAPLKTGSPIKGPSIFNPKLEDWQIDIINTGGFIDPKQKKVKPISLKNKQWYLLKLMLKYLYEVCSLIEFFFTSNQKLIGNKFIVCITYKDIIILCQFNNHFLSKLLYKHLISFFDNVFSIYVISHYKWRQRATFK